MNSHLTCAAWGAYCQPQGPAPQAGDCLWAIALPGKPRRTRLTLVKPSREASCAPAQSCSRPTRVRGATGPCCFHQPFHRVVIVVMDRFKFLLVDHVLAGRWDRDEIAGRLATAVQLPPTTLAIERIADGLIRRFGATTPPPRRDQLCRFFWRRAPLVRRLQQALSTARTEGLSAEHIWEGLEEDVWSAPPPFQMQPGAGIPRVGQLPPLRTPRELAEWFGVTVRQLDWLADVPGRENRRDDDRFRRYRYRWIEKGNRRKRLIERPLPRLKAIQRRILTDILDLIPPHECAHAFRAGRSILSCAAPHVGQRVVLSIDLRDFFPSIPVERIQAVFRWLGYPEAVARILAGLCTNATPDAVVRLAHTAETWFSARLLFGRRHLPQGAPTSPALANLCAYRLDCRLQGLAKASHAVYTRYADDLVFSGDSSFEHRLGRFRVLSGAIALAEGFAIRHRKTRVMRSGKQQRVVGLVVNQRPNVDRREYDALRALLHNCLRTGPQAQNHNDRMNFQQHLAGRIAFVRSVNLQKAERLERVFVQIDWHRAEP